MRARIDGPGMLRPGPSRVAPVDTVRCAAARIAVALAAGLAISGCAGLLPRGEAEVDGGWVNFDAARDAIRSIVPYEATRDTVHAMGLDPGRRANVTLLSYSDLVQRFGTGNALSAQQLERGVRDCFEAGRRCTGYLILQRKVDRHRVGNFWLDMLNFRRETDVQGWSFNALIVFVDEGVVFTLYGGQPRIVERESSTNPLGPLQGIAESRGSAWAR